MLMERTLMERTLEVLDRLVAEGVIGPYAIGGAIAAYKYVEAAFTEDLDILVSFEDQGGMISLAPVFHRLEALGYVEFQREGLMIEGWPVQFLPVASELDRQALATAVALSQPAAAGRPTGMSRVLLPHYLVAIALKVGRPKDLLRVQQFLEEQAVDLSALSALVREHNLLPAWRKYCLATATPFDLLDRGDATL